MERLDRAFRAEEAALGDPGDVPALLRQLLARRPEDARDLEQGDPLDARRSGSARPTRAGRAAGRSAAPPSRSCTAPRAPACPPRRARASTCTPRRSRRRRGRPRPARRRRCSLVSWHGRRGALGQRRRHLLDPEAHDLLDEIDRARDVARAPGRHRHLGRRRPRSRAAAAARPAPRRESPARDRRSTSSGRWRTTGGAGSSPWTSVVPGPARAGERDEQLGRVDRRLLGGVRVDALLPARRRVGAEPQPPRGAQHRQRVEVRRLEQEVRRLVAHLAVLAAHDPGDRDGPLRVGDHEVGRRELALVAVERADLLPRLRAADDDPALREERAVERVQRRAEREHDVVRDVDDVRDRAHAGGEEPRLQPGRRRADAGVAEDPADVARAALEVLDADVDRLVAGRAPGRAPAAAPARRRSGAETSRAMP